jgi:hypothetical protein
MKMGAGGTAAETSVRLEDLITAIDAHLQYFNRVIDEDLARVSRLRRARRQLELRMWETSPMFCRPR